MKKNKLSGVYYKAAPTLLNKQLEGAFLHDKGPGELPGKVGRGKVKGLIVPFEEYDVSGPCSAWAYKALAEAKKPDVVVIVGQVESGAYSCMESFETPFGIARVDQKLVRKLKNVKIDESLFDSDIFVESQLPFLQFLFGRGRTISFVPLLVGPDAGIRELVVDLKEVLLDEGKEGVVIAPTNFTKHGPNYSYLPFSDGINKKVYEHDGGALDLIKKGDVKKYLEYYHGHGMNTDNYLGVIFALLFAKPTKALLEQYYTSADVNGDVKNLVSFASIVLK